LEKLISILSQTQTQKNSVIQLKKNMMYILVAVLVVVIIIAGAAAYLLYGGGGGGTTNPTATPNPTVTVGDASTLTFSANVTTSGQTITYTWAGKDIHSMPVIRVDFMGYSYLLDSGKEKAWSSTDNGATWTADNFATQWASWSQQWSSNVDELTPGHWSGSGDYTFTDLTTGGTITLFNIVINPTIPESTFAEPT
jgi:hypothetical protein